MSILVYFVIGGVVLLLSGILGMVLDTTNKCDSHSLYWALGAFAGLIGMVIVMLPQLY